MIIPAQHIDLERIYNQTLGAGLRSIAITSSNPSEGSSSLAVTLYQRHLLAGKTTLFIDLNVSHSELLPLMETQPKEFIETTPQLLTDEKEQYALLGIPAPLTSNSQMKWRDPGVLNQHIDSWLKEFDAVIIDAGSIHRRGKSLLPAETIISASEACILVVLAGITTTPMVHNSCKRIKSARGNLVGCVYNDLYNPTLQQELLRETLRIPSKFEWFINKLNHWINHNRLLSLEV